MFQTSRTPLSYGPGESGRRGNFENGVWTLMDIDVSRLAIRSSQKPVRINISIPAGLVHDIDKAARASGATRSGFSARAARQAMAANGG